MSAKVEKLPGGLTVVTDRMDHLRTASLGIWVGAGSRNEEVNEHGIAHMLEHMAFKGTRRRNAREIVEEIEAVGGDLNASTGLESTGYYARVLGSDMPLAIDILTDILTDSTFEPVELAREQGVILQEIGAANDTPDDIVYDIFQARAFPDQPIGRPILGTPQSVRSFTPDSLRTYLARNYRAPRMIVSAVGDIDHDAIVETVSKRLGVLAREPVGAAPPARYAGGLDLVVRPLEQAHVVLGLEGRSYLHPDYFAVQIFSGVLGGGASSRLFQEVREKRGLCYTIYASHQPFADTGIFSIYAGTDPNDARELVKVVVDEVADAVETTSEPEVERVKAMMKVGLLGVLESSSARADQLARHMLAYGRPIPLDEIAARIDAVTLEDVRAAGRTLVGAGRPTFAALGPESGLESAAQIAETLQRRAA
jgi:predicted Zn-dependent peptidase